MKRFFIPLFYKSEPMNAAHRPVDGVHRLRFVIYDSTNGSHEAVDVVHRVVFIIHGLVFIIHRSVDGVHRLVISKNRFQIGLKLQ